MTCGYAAPRGGLDPAPPFPDWACFRSGAPAPRDQPEAHQFGKVGPVLPKTFLGESVSGKRLMSWTPPHVYLAALTGGYRSTVALCNRVVVFFVLSKVCRDGRWFAGFAYFPGSVKLFQRRCDCSESSSAGLKCHVRLSDTNRALGQGAIDTFPIKRTH